MDHEQLFTAAKWEILKELSKQNLSPLELSTRVSTSVANISQTLRLLEMAGIVKSKRVPNRDKGQPRIVYSLVKDIIFPLIVSRGFASKEIMEVDPLRKAIIRTWYFPVKKYQNAIEKFLWEIEPQLKEIQKIALEDYNDKKITFSIQPETLAKKITVKSISAKGNNYAISIVPNEGKDAYILYTPSGGNQQI